MKILYILNIANRINSFSYTSILAAKELGWDYHIAGNWGYKCEEDIKSDENKYGIRIHQIDFIRQPYNPKNCIAFKQLLEIVQHEKYDIIHCNTPIGGVIGRLVGKKCGVKHVIYQVHGFHFYKGAPLLNWLIYYPIEKWLAHYSDALITINKEDYERAKEKIHLRNNGKVYYVLGVGIDMKLYTDERLKRQVLRDSISVSSEDVLLISAGDLVRRKNYKTAIEAVAKVKDSRIKYAICGNGPEMDNLKLLALSLGIERQVLFIGHRTDISDLLHAADIFLFTTLQEGLPRSLMEAMACGLPCLVSNIRGNVDLIEDNVCGFLYHPLDSTGFSLGIRRLLNEKEMRLSFGSENKLRIKEYSIEKVKASLSKIYVSETSLEYDVE